ncbi:MAG: DUF4160 domain-containing protein [Alphaproteobacteria bacterium]|nr:DUF4160 domain-containing protein [Alphaproteobacteria bacterium]MDE2162431.1 DUF4160 domain-containing protein [Alphaproteobacteria bacterium]MDE2266194.1 DUF4160 domain-containing protein [Alphaproteobacteria bacterium]
MPTVLRWNGYRFYFFSNEGQEPPHIHVDRGENTVKFWLDPVEVARNIGFAARDLNVIERKVQEERENFIEAWNVYFGSGR